MGGAASAKTSPPQFHAHMMGSQQTPPPTYSPPIRQPTAGGGGLVGAAQGPHMSGVGASSSSSNVTAASVGRIGSPVVSTENPGELGIQTSQKSTLGSGRGVDNHSPNVSRIQDC
jgi:hypothetical protein